MRKDVAKRFPAISRLPMRWIDFLSGYFPPVYLSHMKGIRSPCGAEAEGWLVACPLTPRAMKKFPLRRVYAQIIRAGRLAQRLGARIVGLGALTSSVGDGGITVARALDMPVTTGSSYTVAVACDAAQSAAHAQGRLLREMTVAILGATGSIGSACARMLHGRVRHLVLVGRDAEAVHRLVRELRESEAGRVTGNTELLSLRQADLIISATNAAGPLICPEHLKPGTAIYDLALPSDVSAAVRALGVDAAVWSGGEVLAPGDADFGFAFGLPPRTVYACMAETMALALEGRYESFSLGRAIRSEQVIEIARVAERHGFRPVPLRIDGWESRASQRDTVEWFQQFPQRAGERV